MTQRVPSRALFDWLGRPFADLLDQIAALRQALQDQIDAAERLLAEREVALQSPLPTPPPESSGVEQRLNTRQLDLRVRSVLVRENSANVVRQELAEILSRLGVHKQLDAVSAQAYEVIAAAEELLALLRGEGWVFAFRDILAAGDDVEQAVAEYRDRLRQAKQRFDERVGQLDTASVRHLRQYGVLRYGLLLLLFLGPLLGFWSGAMSEYGKEPARRARVYLPEATIDSLRTLEKEERLVEIGARVEGASWTGDSPADQLSRLAGELEDDQRYAELLCRRLELLLPARSGRAQLVVRPQCGEVLVRADEARRSLLGLGRLLEEQAAFRARLLREVLSTIPPPEEAPAEVATTAATASPAEEPPTPAAVPADGSAP
ncbi:MAG: hypothetical protein RBU45_03230 [Myxococcota bacterium]|nr:hypothetical protein [Myxococcota bacterium]